MESERPVDLDPSQMLDYEMVLEEEAFPFEERAIEVHEKNLELLSVGVFNAWIEKSLGKLAEMMPGRYAKFEASTGLIASIERYAYRTPTVREAVPDQPETEAEAETESEAPETPPDPGVESESARTEHAAPQVAGM
jgi:hypothetical protein